MDRLDEKILDAYQNTVLERKFDLGSGTMGNGIVIWNRAKTVSGDYEKIAHIDQSRKVKYYIKNPPKDVKDYVEKIAKGKNPSASTSQPDRKVFKEGISLPMHYAGYHLNDNVLDGFTVDEIQTMIVSNIPKEKLSTQVVIKEIEKLITSQLRDARRIAKKITPEMIKTLIPVMKD